MQNRNAALLLISALALPLAACGQVVNDHITYALWKQNAPPASTVVTVKPVRLDVAFADGAVSLDTNNEAALNDFLANNHINNGNTVDLAIGPIVQGETAITVKRVNAIEGALGRRGITVDSIQGLPDTAPETVAVLGKLATVTPPNCPGYNAPITFNTELQPIAPLGCSNEMNLNLMVANPADLASGRPLPPADGEALALGVQRYREGKVPALQAPATTGTQ